MNILILNWRDPKNPLAGGAEASLFEQAKYWQKKGATIYWISSEFPNSIKEESIEGIHTLRMGSHYTVHMYAFLYFKKHFQDKIDVIIDCFHFLPFFTPFYAKCKIIALIQEPAKKLWFKNIFFPLSVLGYILEPLFFIPYKKKHFITAAESIRDELINDYKIHEKNISVVHHGVTVLEVAKTIEKEKIPTIMYASRLAKDKGIEDAVEAISILKKSSTEFRFWIIGSAETKNYLEKIKHIIKEKNLDDAVTVFGYISQREKFEKFKKAWILIHPSTKEGWGLNVIEANSVGTPAVGYTVTGLKDSIQDEKTGLLTQKNTPEELARLIGKLLNDNDFYKKLSKNAITWSKQFSWEKAGRESWELIEEINSY